jgi:hypothetical protein
VDATWWVDEDEIVYVIAAFMAVRQGRTVTRDETAQIIAWANDVRRQATALDLVVRGALGVDVVDARITFSASAGLQTLLRDLLAPEPADGTGDGCSDYGRVSHGQRTRRNA